MLHLDGLIDHHLFFNEKEHSFHVSKEGIPSVRNADLFQRVEQLVNDFFLEIDNYFRSGGKQVRTPDDIERFCDAIFLRRNGYLDKCAQQDPEIARFRKSLTLFDECIALIVRDEAIKRLNDTDRIPSAQPSSPLFEHELLALLRRLSEELASRIRASIDVFDHERRRVRHLPLAKYYKRFEDYLYDEFNRSQIIVELNNFETSVDNIPLDADTAIIRLTAQHLESIRHIPRVFTAPRESWQAAHRDGFALQLTHKWKKRWDVSVSQGGVQERTPIVTPETTALSELINPFRGLPVTALRLLKKGEVGYRSIFFIGSSPFAEWMPMDAPIEFLIPHEESQMRYSLLESEVSELLDLLNDLGTNRSEALNMGLKRFNLAYTRVRPEDRLLDLLIAFESLFLEGGGELSYRLSIRTAALLGKSADGRSKIFEDMRRAYDIRSKVVHGQRLESKDFGPSQDVPVEKLMQDFVPQIEAHLRLSIRTMLKMPASKGLKALHADLDRRIFAPS
jgi:hypothetical protein